MRRSWVMAVCALGLLVLGAAESQAGCCLFGGLFHSSCYAPQSCCYAPPACCPSPCYSNTCGYSSVSNYAPQACCPSACGYDCSGCSSCGSSCYGGGCATGCYGGGCATGNCGVGYQPAPTAAVYAPAPAFQAQFVSPIVRQPVVLTTPRYTTQTISFTPEPVAAQTKPANVERRQSTTSSQWEPVSVIR